MNESTQELKFFEYFPRDLYPNLISSMSLDEVIALKRTNKIINDSIKLTVNVLLRCCIEEIKRDPKNISRICRKYSYSIKLTDDVLLGCCIEEIRRAPKNSWPICQRHGSIFTDDYEPPQNNINRALQALTVLLFARKFNSGKFDEAIKFAKDESEKNPSLKSLYNSLEISKSVRTAIEKKDFVTLTNISCVNLDRPGVHICSSERRPH